jgi:hypothetical protein
LEEHKVTKLQRSLGIIFAVLLWLIALDSMGKFFGGDNWFGLAALLAGMGFALWAARSVDP